MHPGGSLGYEFRSFAVHPRCGYPTPSPNSSTAPRGRFRREPLRVLAGRRASVSRSLAQPAPRRSRVKCSYGDIPQLGSLLKWVCSSSSPHSRVRSEAAGNNAESLPVCFQISSEGDELERIRAAGGSPSSDGRLTISRPGLALGGVQSPMDTENERNSYPKEIPSEAPCFLWVPRMSETHTRMSCARCQLQ